jgi:hypothetical protein
MPTDEQFVQVGLNLGDPDVNRLVFEVLSRPDAAEALEYIVDSPVGGPSCYCGGDHWQCDEKLDIDEWVAESVALADPPDVLKRGREECRKLGAHLLPREYKPGDVHVCERCGIKRTVPARGYPVYSVEQF